MKTITMLAVIVALIWGVSHLITGCVQAIAMTVNT